MRVLLFRSLCDTGGVSSSMLLLGRQLVARGIACEYWFCRPSNRLAEFQAEGGATLGPLSQLAARFAKRDFDVVHMTTTDPAAPLVAHIAGDARVVVTARGAISDLWDSRHCHAHTAISVGMAEINQPFTDLEIDVVRNSLDVSRYSPPAERTEGAPILAFVGRTTSKEKDFPRFTRIARRLASRGMRIWIADPHEASWERFDGQSVEKIEAERWGPVPHPDMPGFYRAVAASGGIVLITSLSEGFGNVAPEAAACGARVAAPDVLGLREAVLDGVTGRLFPATASDDDVAARLESWLSEDHDPAACADATRQEFSPAVMVDAYTAIYQRKEQRLATRKAPAPPDTPEVRHLMGHLARQGGWRAEFARSAAVELAAAGYKREAFHALSSAFRDAPGQFLSRAAARQVMIVGRCALASRRQVA
jgi:glycosyltransferase involved in cell wall biosynthesis